MLGELLKTALSDFRVGWMGMRLPGGGKPEGSQFGFGHMEFKESVEHPWEWVKQAVKHTGFKSEDKLEIKFNEAYYTGGCEWAVLGRFWSEETSLLCPSTCLAQQVAWSSTNIFWINEQVDTCEKVRTLTTNWGHRNESSPALRVILAGVDMKRPKRMVYICEKFQGKDHEDLCLVGEGMTERKTDRRGSIFGLNHLNFYHSVFMAFVTWNHYFYC